MKASSYMKLIFSALLLFSFHFSWAQTARIQGKILDADDGQPLIAATVQIGSIGAITDIDGKFMLEVPEGDYELQASYIGYEPAVQAVDIKKGEVKNIDLKLVTTATILQTATVTSGKYDKPLGEVTVSMEIVKPKLIEATNTTSADQVLNKVPGVQVIDGQANIRGGSGWSYGAGSRVLLLIDDIPYLQADAGLPQWADVPIENAEQIEVVKGAASALYGSSALNGIIHFRTGYATSQPVTKISTFANLTMSPKDKDKQWWDKAPHQVGLSFQHKQKIKKFDLVLSGYALSRKGGLVKNTFNRYGRLTANTRYRISDKLTVGVNGNFNRGEGRNYFYWSGSGANAYIGDSTTESNSNRFRYTIDPFVTYYDDNGFRHKFNGRFYSINNISDNNQSNGSKLYYGEYQIQKNMEDIDLVATAGVVGIRTNVTAELYGDTSYHANNLAGYFQLDKKFFGRLNLSAGMRYEMNKIVGPKTILVGDDVVVVDENEQQESKPVFRFGTSYQIAKSTFARASWGQGYRYPTIAEKFISTVTGQADILPNPNLQSETGWSTEIAIKQGFKIANWTGFIDVAAFWSEYEDMLEFRITKIFPRAAFQSLNVGGTIIKGIDVSLGGQGNIGQVNLGLIGGYTYLDPKFKDFTTEQNFSSSVDYNILKYRFKHSFKMDMQATYKKLSLGGGYIYNSNIEAIDNVLQVLIPELMEYRERNDKGAQIVDVRMAYQVTKGAKASVILKNALNEEYMYRPGILKAPRNITFRLDYTF